MTRKEFEERTGLNVSAVEFCTVNDIYMAAGEMDKDITMIESELLGWRL